MTFGDKLRAVRKEKGLTQKALGELCGMSNEMVRRYELGIRNPKWETIERLANGLDVSMSYLTNYRSSEEIKRLEEMQISEKEFDSLEVDNFILQFVTQDFSHAQCLEIIQSISNLPKEAIPDIDFLIDFLAYKYKVKGWGNNTEKNGQ